MTPRLVVGVETWRAPMLRRMMESLPDVRDALRSGTIRTIRSNNRIHAILGVNGVSFPANRLPADTTPEEGLAVVLDHVLDPSTTRATTLDGVRTAIRAQFDVSQRLAAMLTAVGVIVPENDEEIVLELPLPWRRPALVARHGRPCFQRDASPLLDHLFDGVDRVVRTAQLNEPLGRTGVSMTIDPRESIFLRCIELSPLDALHAIAGLPDTVQTRLRDLA